MKFLIQSVFVFSLLIAAISCNTNTKTQAKADKECCSKEASSCCESSEVVKSSCCTKGEDGKLAMGQTELKDSLVMVYYFHGTRRCETCKAVETVTKETIENKFADKAIFTSLNREDENVKGMLNSFKVSGQTLLVVYGSKVENLTNDAFLNARNNPEKLKEKLSSVIETMMN